MDIVQCTIGLLRTNTKSPDEYPEDIGISSFLEEGVSPHQQLVA